LNKFKTWLVHRLGGYTVDEKLILDMDSTKTAVVKTVSATRTITCFYNNLELERMQESIRTELSRSLPIRFIVKEDKESSITKITGQTDIIYK
jgi:hypothetical protein